ncbi:MAG: insulinase family protein, partial [Desulfobacterales bacterium]|nr:insulinase family protein [Desulfobacterales bacterium]
MRTLRLILIFFPLFFIMSLAPASVFGLDVEKKVLQNGLTVLHVQRTNLPMVTFTLLVRGGQRNEPADSAGLANLTAGLMTEGTSKRSSTQISKETDFIGASLSVNASDDYSTVNLSVLKKHLDTGFELFSDVLLHPSFSEEEIERQKAQILAALKRNQEDPDYVAHTAFIKAVYGDHPYGHPSLGTPEGIGYITRDDITGF